MPKLVTRRCIYRLITILNWQRTAWSHVFAKNKHRYVRQAFGNMQQISILVFINFSRLHNVRRKIIFMSVFLLMSYYREKFYHLFVLRHCAE